MSANDQLLDNLIHDFNMDTFETFLRRLNPAFTPGRIELSLQMWGNEAEKHVRQAHQLGILPLDPSDELVIVAIKLKKELTGRESRRRQYEWAKHIIKQGRCDGGIFAFYDDAGNFRLSLVTATYWGPHRTFSHFRRYTFFVSPTLPNKTFIQQMRQADFGSLDGIRKAFSLEAVSDAFYQDFKPKFDAIAASVGQNSVRTSDRDESRSAGASSLEEDFALLFVIRTIFLGFVQKKGWLGGNPTFLQDFWNEYRRQYDRQNRFYKEWLEPLFFDALNSPPGRMVAYGDAPYSPATQQALQMTPFLNGELFKRKIGVDDQGLWIPDQVIGDFFDFLFQYNFTVEENELYDEELELNPEFLGIIFERLTNMEQGAIYTPRVVVDLMCRLALVRWLEQTTKIDKTDLYHLFFREAGTGEAYDEYQKQGDLSADEIRTLIEKLESITVCDPAAGSGAFEVGMLQVLDATLENLYNRTQTPRELKDKASSPFERKKAIIANSLYGVEVKRWAVWINHLRLWLSLFVDMPDEFQQSFKPLLPNLTFKVRAGDSLVQRLAGKAFPVQGHAVLSPAVKRRITELKKKKVEFFYNQSDDDRPIEQEERAVFQAVLDEEIAARQQKLRQILTPQERQASFIPSQAEQLEMDIVQAQEAQRKELERDIAALEEQRRTLKEERPFIWSIEFAEIFFDRGGFDIIIGNPPYVRHEDISDPNGSLSPAAYKKALKEMLLLDFPGYFAKSPSESDTFKKGRQPDGRSDLYTYFYIRSLRLLHHQGVHVFVCSNSWLDVGYGAWLQEFFVRQAPLYLVIDNQARRSFARADVNTIITVAGAPRPVPAHHVVRFVSLKKPFEEVVLSENLLAIEGAAGIQCGDGFRVYPITAAELLAEGSEDGRYLGDKWGGKYLRAPDIMLRLLKQDTLLPITHVARVLGYVHDNNTGKAFPRTKFVKSIKDLRRIALLEEDTCLYGVNERGNARDIGDLLFARTFGELYFVVLNLCRAVGKEFYRIQARRIHPERLALLMNSTFAMLQRELLGIHLGGGAVKFSADEVRRFRLPRSLISMDELPFPGKEGFLLRPVNSIYIECGLDPESEVPLAEQEPEPLPDRKALDDIVFDALGLTEEERKEVYRAVCQLVSERLNRASSVG